MDILREKIVAAVNGAGFYSDENDFYTDAELAADAILAIPELKEALARPKATLVERERTGHRDFRGGNAY